MDKLQCGSCEEIFEEDEAETIETTYEKFYGVSRDVTSRTPLRILVCPFCGCEELYDVDDLEDEDEFTIGEVK